MTECQEKNLVICVSGGGQKVPFTALMTNALPSLHMADIDGSQCFPMFLYETVEEMA
ncbi:type ISP restriction/modification enzyme [Sphingomonas sp. Leaf32]|uniref:type ISP restriction/modification enzyme n=1 Tax=Sphingomonas sp. Leaf32 TaxID=1736214 RepID=UPI00138F2A3A